MPSFHGGPLDGQVGYQQGMDPPPDQLAAAAVQGPDAGAGPAGGGGDPMAAMMGGQGGPAGNEGPSEGEPGLSASAKFDRILADARELASSDGNFSEADKLILEQITTLLQKLKATNEKQVGQAIAGKMSPAVGAAYA